MKLYFPYHIYTRWCLASKTIISLCLKHPPLYSSYCCTSFLKICPSINFLSSSNIIPYWMSCFSTFTPYKVPYPFHPPFFSSQIKHLYKLIWNFEFFLAFVFIYFLCLLVQIYFSRLCSQKLLGSFLIICLLSAVYRRVWIIIVPFVHKLYKLFYSNISVEFKKRHI